MSHTHILDRETRKKYVDYDSHMTMHRLCDITRTGVDSRKRLMRSF